MRRILGALLFSLVICSVTCSQEVKKGEFQTTFTERSPLSAKADLIKRLGDIPDAPDYDLSKEPFTVYVPENYDPATPVGIIVWMNYKPADIVPPQWKPVLDAKHMIFIVSKNNAQPEWVRCGLMLDAVHNLKKLYKIDDERVYLFGYPNPNEYTIQRMGFASGDVFRGYFYAVITAYYRQITGPDRRYLPARLPRPQGPMLALAKTRKHILAPDSEDKSPYPELTAKAYQQDGFTHVIVMTVSRVNDVHYPNMTTPWLEKALEYLDAPLPAPATPPATSQPIVARGSTPVATRPAVSDAQRQVNLAKSYIAAKNYAQARTRLQQVIDSSPNDPAAKEARQLLDEIKGK